ncbi:MAG: DUF423 domain-containing protein [Hyphomonadaceae bacterium]
MTKIGLTPLLAALSGFVCVAVGAFGAHAIADPHARELIEIGVRYNMWHTMAAIASVSFRNWGAPIARFAAPFFFVGIVLFSGSLYLRSMGMSMAAMTIMAPPLGGLAFLTGWAILIAAGLQLIKK